MIKPVLSMVMPFTGLSASHALVEVDQVLKRHCLAHLGASFRSIQAGVPPRISLESFDLRGLEDAIARSRGFAGLAVSYAVQLGKLPFDIDVFVYAPNADQSAIRLSFDKTFTSRFFNRKSVQAETYMVISQAMAAIGADYSVIAHNVDGLLLPRTDPKGIDDLNDALGRYSSVYALGLQQNARDSNRFDWAFDVMVNEVHLVEASLSIMEFQDFGTVAKAYA